MSPKGSMQPANDGFGRWIIDMPDAPRPSEPSGGGGGGGGLMLFIGGIVFIVAVVTQLIYVTTGTNVFDYFDGITGPCGTCTSQSEVP